MRSESRSFYLNNSGRNIWTRIRTDRSRPNLSRPRPDYNCVMSCVYQRLFSSHQSCCLFAHSDHTHTHTGSGVRAFVIMLKIPRLLRKYVVLYMHRYEYVTRARVQEDPTYERPNDIRLSAVSECWGAAFGCILAGHRMLTIETVMHWESLAVQNRQILHRQTTTTITYIHIYFINSSGNWWKGIWWRVSLLQQWNETVILHHMMSILWKTRQM